MKIQGEDYILLYSEERTIGESNLKYFCKQRKLYTYALRVEKGWRTLIQISVVKTQARETELMQAYSSEVGGAETISGVLCSLASLDPSFSSELPDPSCSIRADLRRCLNVGGTGLQSKVRTVW